MKSKKAAMEMEEFGKYLLVIASFIILLVFVVKFFGGLQGAGVEQACRSSVSLRTTLHWDKKVTNIYPLQCETQEFMIPQEKLSKRADEGAIKRAVYGEIADMMAQCWWMFGNGYYHNLLDDDHKDDRLCHVCYSFVINPRYATIVDENGVEKTINYNLDELNMYMANTPHSPGLLQGGGALFGDAGDHDFTPQETPESSMESRKLTAERIINSRQRLDSGVADFSGIFVDKEDKLETLRDQLKILRQGDTLAPVVVITPSIAEEDLEEGSTLPMQLMQEWQIGDSLLENGMVFVVSLNDGKVLYATGYGAAGVLYRSDIENALSNRFDAEMAAGSPDEAVIALIEELKENINSQDFIKEKLRFQQSYMGYITGGTRVFDIGSEDKYYGNDKLTTQGSLAFEPGLTTFIPGDYYAVTYINSFWRSDTKFHYVTQIAAVSGAVVGAAVLSIATLGTATPFIVAAAIGTTGGAVVGGVVGAAGNQGATWIGGKTNDASIPNMIGLSSYEGLLENSICNTNLDEG